MISSRLESNSSSANFNSFIDKSMKPPMKVLPLFFLSLVFTPFVAANSYKEIEKACEKARDLELCVRAYQGLPPFPLTESTEAGSFSSASPIAIPVIPYVANPNKKNKQIMKRSR